MKQNGEPVSPGAIGEYLATIRDLHRQREILSENLRRAGVAIAELQALANAREEQRAAASVLLGLAIIAAGGELRVTQEQQREMRGRKARIVRRRDDETGDLIWTVQT